MSLRDILQLTQQPISAKTEFCAQTFKILTQIIMQLIGICEDEDVQLSRKVHCLDLKQNEWHIAIMQIYENLYREDLDNRNNRGELKFDKEGNIVEPPKVPGAIETPTLSGSLRPFLEFIDGYRRRVAAPQNTIVRTKYSNYADLDYIQ